jgi:hypothetical protein
VPEPSTHKDHIDYAKDHFFFIAEQRIKMMHYYILVWAACVAGSIQVFSKDKIYWQMLMGLGFIYIVVAGIFTIIEVRNISLVEGAKSNLRDLEAHAEWPAHARICTNNNHKAKATYRFALGIALGTQYLAGVALLFSVVWFADPSPEPERQSDLAPAPNAKEISQAISPSTTNAPRIKRAIVKDENGAAEMSAKTIIPREEKSDKDRLMGRSGSVSVSEPAAASHDDKTSKAGDESN